MMIPGADGPPSTPAASAFPLAFPLYIGRKLHGQVVHALGRRVVGGRYPVGTVLPNEDGLCQELAVSRTAVREAVKVLAAKGLLQARPRTGTRVRERAHWNLLDPDVLAWRCECGVDAEFLRHLTELREIIEPGAAALAAASRSGAQLQALETAFGAMQAANDLQQWVRADLAFHTAILQATNNPLLMPLAAIIGSALEALLEATARSARDFRAALPEHQQVFEAIRDTDGARAMRAMTGLLGDTRALMHLAAPR